MADSSPDRPEDRSRRSSSPSETQQTPALSTPSPPSVRSPSRASVPPSEPRSTSRASFSQVDLSADRPARLQMIVALILGLVLVAIPLYLWRRPRAESIAASSSTDAGAESPVSAAPTATTAVAAAPRVTLGEARSVLCQDPGPKKTAPEQCGHVVEIEKALAAAIEQSASCLPKEAGGGTVQYVADVSFKRKAVNVAAPKDGRSIKSAKAVAVCQSAVKGKLRAALSLGAIPHEHARYKIAITATYAGAAE
jgi:hypothetical protein